MDATGILKIAAALISTVLGVTGVLVQTRTVRGKLTKWARLVLAGLLASGLIAVVVEVREARAGAERAEHDRKAQALQLDAIQQTLHEVVRTTNAIPDNLAESVAIRVPATAFGVVADELRRIAHESSGYEDGHHPILFEELSNDALEVTRLAIGQVSLRIWHPLTDRRALADRVLAVRFQPSGLVYYERTDEVVIWSDPAKVKFQVNSSKLVSFVDLPGCKTNVEFFTLFCMAEPCTVDYINLQAEDGRTFGITGFRRTGKTTNDGAIPRQSGPAA